MPPWRKSGAGGRKTEHLVKNALQRLGSPAYTSGVGSLGSCWGLLFPGTGRIGGVGGAAGDLNSCNWVVSSDTCATNTCTARPVFSIFSSCWSIRALLLANSSWKPRASAESIVWSDPSVMNKDWRIQVAETRTVYCKHVRQVKLRKQGWALRRIGAGSAGKQWAAKCPVFRVQETAEIRNHGSRKQERTKTTDHDTGRQSEDLTTQDSVTGSNIAPVNDPQLERISLNQTHPYTDTCTHTQQSEDGTESPWTVTHRS